MFAYALVILQLASALLTNVQANPNISAEQRGQAISFANNAIQTALQIVKQNPLSNESPVKSTPPQTNNLGAGAVSVPISPSCTLTGTAVNVSPDPNVIAGKIKFDWTLTGMRSNTEGQLYVWRGTNGGEWIGGTPLNESSRNNPDIAGFGQGTKFKAIFGNISCYASFPDNQHPYEGELSTTP